MTYNYEEFNKDVAILAKLIKENFEPQALVAVARGGLTLGHFLASMLDKRELFCLNSIHYENDKKLDNIKIFNLPDLKAYEKILLIDDMIDSGETMLEIKKILKENFPDIKLKIATIFYKENALLKPDFCLKEAKEWIDFFWEVKL